MNIFKKLTLAVLVMMTSAAAMAQEKVVVFNMQAAIMGTELAKQRIASLEANPEFAMLKAKYESLQADLASMNREAAKDGMTWGAEKQANFRKQGEYKQADLKLAAEKLKSESNAVAQGIMNELAPKAKDVLQQIITSQGIGLVLDQSVAYHADAKFNITAKVTQGLNKAK